MNFCFVCSAEGAISTFASPAVCSCGDCVSDLARFIANGDSATLLDLWGVPSIANAYLEEIAPGKARTYADLALAYLEMDLRGEALAAASSAMRSGARDSKILAACLHVIVANLVDAGAIERLAHLLRALAGKRRGASPSDLETSGTVAPAAGAMAASISEGSLQASRSPTPDEVLQESRMNTPVESPPVVLTGRVITACGHDDDPLGVIVDGAVALESGRIAFVGTRTDLPDRFRSLTPVCAPLITPGLIDAHTHAAWMGSGHSDYLATVRGESRRGGGIYASMRAVQEASVFDFALVIPPRLARMASLGVTTIEVKTGYGILPDLEKRQMIAIATTIKLSQLRYTSDELRNSALAAAEQGVPRIVPTFLALHALPEETGTSEAKRRLYIDTAAGLVVEVAKLGARFVDLCVDSDAFSLDEARVVARRAREIGVGIRLHVGKTSDIGGAELAAELGAHSADHLEHVSARGVEALSRARVSATLLPLTGFTLGLPRPPIELFREAQVPIVVASDANPQTAPTESLPLALALAVRMYGLSTPEAVLSVTRNAARSLGISDIGELREGMRGDVVAWDLPHEDALLQPWGRTCARAVFCDGRRLSFAGAGAVINARSIGRPTS